MERLTGAFLRVCLGLVPTLGILWIFSVSDYFGIALAFQQVVGVLLGLAVAAAYLKYPYMRRAGWLEILLAIAIVQFKD